MDLVVGIVCTFILVLCLAGTIGYKDLRRKWAGIIGVGGSYIVLIGVVQLVVLVAGLIKGLVGHEASLFSETSPVRCSLRLSACCTPH